VRRRQALRRLDADRGPRRRLEGTLALFTDEETTSNGKTTQTRGSRTSSAARKSGWSWRARLFSPSFIVWLTESAPQRFAFELVNGILCCYVNDHKESAADLDAVAAASAAVANRLREESLE
jgi:hypothetical protein